jgi:alkylhydroperoxidase family enzyme
MTTAPGLRLSPVPFSEWDEQTRTAMLSHLRRSERYLSGAPDAPPMPVVLELFAQHVPVTDTFMAFTDALAAGSSTLEPKQRELAILRVAWRTGSGYEWHQHRRMGGDVGLSEEQLAAVPAGADAAVWSESERALLCGVDEMIDAFAISQDTWDVLAASYGPAQLLELLFVVGGYLCLAAVLNSIGLRGGSPGGAETAAP